MGVGWDMSTLYGGPPSSDGNTSNDTVISVARIYAKRDESGSVNSPPAAGQAISEATNVSYHHGFAWTKGSRQGFGTCSGHFAAFRQIGPECLAFCGTWQSAGRLRGNFAARAGDVHSWMPGHPRCALPQLLNICC
jgi:hypothetical protein